MRISGETARIGRLPLNKLLANREFRQRLTVLGKNALNRRESSFLVDLEGPGTIALSAVKAGEIAAGHKGQEAGEPTAINIHNHPAWGRTTPFDFFSDQDLLSILPGEICGLVSVPHERSVLLLLTQARSPERARGFNLFWYDRALAEMTEEFEIERTIFDCPQSTRHEAVEETWMRLAVEGLIAHGLYATAAWYQAADGDRSLPAPRLIHGDLSKLTMSLRWLEQIGKLIMQETEQEMAEMFNEKPLTATQIARQREQQARDANQKPNIYFPYASARAVTREQYDRAQTLLLALSEKTPGISYQLRFELAMELIKRGLISGQPIYVKGQMSLADFKIGKRDAALLEGMHIYTLLDVSVGLDVHYKEARQMLRDGQIVPDFEIEYDGKKEQIFLGLPKIKP
jgi:hypothetical protein